MSALWPAALVGIAKVVSNAFTGTSALSLDTFGVGSTWRRFTRIDGFTLPQYTLNKWIASVVVQAHARDGMADDSAFSIDTTRARAGISTLLIDARLIALAF